MLGLAQFAPAGKFIHTGKFAPAGKFVPTGKFVLILLLKNLPAEVRRYFATFSTLYFPSGISALRAVRKNVFGNGFDERWTQGCQIFPKRRKIYQMNTKCTKRAQHTYEYHLAVK
jgi:hypothetical protein